MHPGEGTTRHEGTNLIELAGVFGDLDLVAEAIPVKVNVLIAEGFEGVPGAVNVSQEVKFSSGMMPRQCPPQIYWG